MEVKDLFKVNDEEDEGAHRAARNDLELLCLATVLDTMSDRAEYGSEFCLAAIRTIMMSFCFYNVVVVVVVSDNGYATTGQDS